MRQHVYAAEDEARIRRIEQIEREIQAAKRMPDSCQDCGGYGVYMQGSMDAFLGKPNKPCGRCRGKPRKPKEDTMNLYEVAAFWTPNAAEIKAGKKPRVVLDKTTVLAKDEASANFQAARLIKEEDAADASQITIRARLF